MMLYINYVIGGIKMEKKKFERILDEYCSKCEFVGVFTKGKKIGMWCKTSCPNEVSTKCKRCRSCEYLDECLHDDWAYRGNS